MTEPSRLTFDRSLEAAPLPSPHLAQPESAFKTSPLSLAQHQVWLSEQLDPGGTAYHIAGVYGISGFLQPQILEQAFNEIIRRHEALRTTFTVADEEAVQVIHPAPPLSLPIIDLSHLAEAERELAASEHIREEAARPFDLTSGPLLRATLLRLGERYHLLSIVTHHIVSDGWSVGVLLRELGQIYTALVRGEPAPLPELPIQYAGYATRQREWLRGEELERHLGYWRRCLVGVPPVLELPSDRTRPAVRSTRGGRLSLWLPEGLTARLRELSRDAGGTLFMTLLAGFKTLLSRYAARADMVVGTAVAGRRRRETEGLIGLFVNTLVLRTDLSGEPAFLEVLRRVRQVFLDGYEHQDVPIEMLVRELRVERSLSHTPLVQVFFNMLNFSATAFEAPGLEIQQLSPPETGSKFDLTLYAQDHPARLRFTLVYSTDLFDEARMRELLEQFKNLLEQVSENPRTSITQYSLLTGGARKLLPDPARVIESEWPGAAHALLVRQARRTPDRTALADAQRTWTYRELDERSSQLAHHLLATGVQAGDLLAIYAHRSAPLIWAMFGVLKAGAAFVILDPAYPEHRLIEYLRVVKARGWLHVAAAGEAPPVLDSFLAARPLLCRMRLHSHAATEEIAATNNSLPQRRSTTPDSPDSLAHYATGAPKVTIKPADLAYVAFTSGSTGRPKAVMGSHDSLTHFHVWIQETFGVGQADRFSMLSGLSHDPLLRDVFTPLLLGAALHIPNPEIIGLPGRLARWMNDAGITVTNLTPAMGEMLNEFPGEDDRLELTHLRHAFFVGDVLTRRDVSQFRRLAPAASCINFYGATETQRALGYFVVPVEHGDKDQERMVRDKGKKEVLPVGRGITNVQLLVLNAKRHLAGIGETGEIYFRTPHLAKGYWDDPALTREYFVPNPFTDVAGDKLYKTGDLGRYLPDGNLEILGRVDLQVKVRGFRVEPGEVEAALREYPGVRECVVAPREDAAGNRRLVGYQVIQDGREVSARDLREHLRKRLPDYMVPSAFVFLEVLPVTPNGKVDRDALPSPDDALTPTHGDYAGPQTPEEEALAEIWRQALTLHEVRSTDNFFELGGHSLLVTRVLSRVRETLQVDLPGRSLFEAPTLEQFTAHVEAAMRDASGNPAVSIPRYPPETEPPLSSSQEGLLVREWWEEVRKLRKRPSQLAFAFRLTGPLDLPLLERAINEILRRHDILRATFPQTRGILTWEKLHRVFKAILGVRAVQSGLLKLDYRGASKPSAPGFTGGRRQIIRAHMAVPLRVVDLEDVRGEEKEAEISRILRDDGAAAFDYESGPLLRVVAVRSSPQEHVVHFVLHHLVCDAWSMRVFVREVLTLYRALAMGKPSPLPELAIQYADFARWQREWFRGDNLQVNVSYWKEQFSGIGLFPELALPFIRTRPNQDSHHPVEAQSLTIPSPLSQSLKKLGYARGATTYVLFMAALDVLLHRYAGVPKISIYTPFANRSRVETQGLIGWVSNVHVVSVDCSGNPAFSELLRRVREAVLGAYAHQEVPYLQLVKTLLRQDQGYAMPRRVSEAPYVFFDYVAQTQKGRQVGPLTLTPLPLAPSSAAAGVAGLEVRLLERAALGLRGEERPARMVVTIRYSPDVVEPAAINGMLSDFRQLLQGVVNDPETRILNLPLA